MKLLLFFAFILSASGVFGQLDEVLSFSDTSGGFFKSIAMDIKVSDGIIISGNRTVNGTLKPVIAKVNTSGDIVWSTASATLPTAQATANVKIELFSDGYIYGSSYEYQSSQLLWKVDAQTGEVAWIQNFAFDYSLVSAFSELDATRFIAVYKSSQYSSHIAIFSKATGAILDESEFSTWGEYYYNTAVDESGNIFLSFRDKLRKYNGSDLGEIVWEHTYVDGPNEMNEIHTMYMDENGDTYLFGRDGGSFGNGNGVVIRVDPATGSEVWNEIASNGDVMMVDFVDRNGNFYATYQHTLVGGGTYYWKTAKVAKSDGQVAWTTNLSVTLQAGAVDEEGEKSALSLDVDCNGDIYQTGYYNADNYGPGNWAIMKLDGATGDKLYDLTIADDSTLVDHESEGRVVAVFNDAPIILGQVQIGETYDFNSLYVTIDPSNGAILQRKRLGAAYTWPSNVPQIVSDTNSTFVMKQAGPKLRVEHFLDGNMAWEYTVPGNTIVFGKQLALSADAVYVFGRTVLPAAEVPFYQEETNQLALFKLDRITGGLLGSQLISGIAGDARPLQLTADDDRSYFFYTQGDSVYYRSWNGTLLSDENLLDSLTQYLSSTATAKFVYNDTNRLIAAAGNGLRQIDKTTLVATTFLAYPQPMNISSMASTDTTLFVGGRSGADAMTASIDLASAAVNWIITYPTADDFPHLSADSIYLYVSAVDGNQTSVRQLSASDGTENWSYAISATNDVVPLALSAARNHDYVVVSGKIPQAPGVSDAIAVMVTREGELLGQYELADELGSESSLSASASVNDSVTWIGGMYTTVSNPLSGRVFSVAYDAPPEIPNEITFNIFVLPSPVDSCLGVLTVTAQGVAPFTFDIGNGAPATTPAYADFDSLCPGVYPLFVTDGDGDTTTTWFVIPSDSNYVFNNPFADSLALDSLGSVIENCAIYYNGIDTAYIVDIFANADTVTVTWTVADANGLSTIMTTYILGNGNGVYDLQLSVYCPQKSLGDYFTVTQTVYLGDDGVHLLDVPEKELPDAAIFPNPTSDLVTVSIADHAQLVVYDTFGRIIAVQTIQNGGQVSLKNEQSGVYFFELSNENGRAVKRIVKR